MVSIYNDNFTTPDSRVPYFIEVYRCVDAADCSNSSPKPQYPVPLNMTEIEIVVPGLTNNYQDLQTKPKFYKYVVYNHTTCKCGQLIERNLTKKIENNEGILRKSSMAVLIASVP